MCIYIYIHTYVYTWFGHGSFKGSFKQGSDFREIGEEFTHLTFQPVAYATTSPNTCRQPKTEDCIPQALYPKPLNR